jgi:hypothetical protein
VSEALSTIYRDLTRSSKHSTGTHCNHDTLCTTAATEWVRAVFCGVFATPVVVRCAHPVPTLPCFRLSTPRSYEIFCGDAFVFVVHGYPTIWLYRLLTLSTLFPLLSGGRASLTLDNMDEPYLGGIRFTIMPPMKRHM